MLAPSQNQPAEGPNLGPAGTYIGPVHDIDNTVGFAAALVPHPNEEHMLVWVNVWAYTPWRSWGFQEVTYCKRVPKLAATSMGSTRMERPISPHAA